MFVLKKDGILRSRVEYRRLNAGTVRGTYPIPRMDEFVDSLQKARIILTFDIISGYREHRILRWTNGVDHLAFAAHDGLYKYIRMPLNFKNASATLRRAIDVLLASGKWQFALVDINDTIIFSSTPKGDPQHVEEVLKLLFNAEMTVKL